jgi:hypothetical protein
MSIDILGFEWDEHNLSHLRERHPDISVEVLEEIVLEAKRYVRGSTDRYGKVAYGARRGDLQVWFNIKKGGVARIFSVREVR